MLVPAARFCPREIQRRGVNQAHARKGQLQALDLRSATRCALSALQRRFAEFAESELVPRAGLEPACACARRILSSTHYCLPMFIE